MGCVSIVKTHVDLKQSLHNALDLLGGINTFVQKHDRVLLKPNLNDFECFTTPELTAALIELLFDNNIRNVHIGESTFGNERITNNHFIKTGYIDLAKKYNIDIINLNKSKAVPISVNNPLILQEINIAEDVLWATKIINLPVMKVHYATGVTLCLKNLKGLLARDEKRHFHEVALDKAIVDLNNSIKADLHIIDGITCMETMGPKGGDLLNLNLIIAGKNGGEVDYIGSKIMGYDLSEVPHLRYYLEANKINVNEIRVLGEKYEHVMHPFKKVNMEKLVPPFVTIYNRNACSSCANALLLSFRFLEKQLPDHLDVYLGTKHKIMKGPNIKVGFGNCCIKEYSFDRSVKGCPPYPFELKKILESFK